jgi:hypothetical protein
MTDNQPTHFSSDRIGETLPKTFVQTLTRPAAWFEAMPTATGYRDSAVLLAIYILVPALVASILTGFITIIVILPLSLVFGFAATWMWAWYLAWASRAFCKAGLTTADAFQICAAAAAPLVFSSIPLLAPVASLWNLYLNWQGLVSHGKVGGGCALLIILAAFVILGGSLLVLFVLLLQLAHQSGLSLPPMPSPMQSF